MLCLAALIGLAPVCRGETAAVPGYANTNIILISIDTLRYDHLGCYGYQRNTSGNIDAIARKGVVFENFISQAVLTPISQMSILTSQDPRVNGMTSFEVPVDAVTDKTLPRILKHYGYLNAAFLGSPEFHQSRYVQDNAISRDHADIFGKSFDVFTPPKGRSIPGEALSWIESHKDRKFFLWLPLGTVHRPFSRWVPYPFNKKFDLPDYIPFVSRLKDDGTRSKDGAITSRLLARIYKNVYYGISTPPYQLSDKDIEHILSRYDAGIYYTDMFVGQVMSLLDKLNLTDNTLVVLHSVHGEDLGEHGYYYHYDLYDTEVKNALVMKFPGDRFKGKRIVTQVQGLDIVPTLLDYLGIPLDHEAEGISLLPLIEGVGAPKVNEFAYTTRTPLWEYLLLRGRSFTAGSQELKVTGRVEGERLSRYIGSLRQSMDKYDPQYPPNDIALRTNEWKLILRRDRRLLEDISWWSFVSRSKVKIDEIELYDLKRDPLEQKNVASERPDVAARLKERLLAWDALIESRKARRSGSGERFIIPYP